MPKKLIFVYAAAAVFIAAAASAEEMATFPVLDGQVHEGVASCASSNCHGSVKQYQNSRILHNEYITWDREDIHSEAYKKMFTKAFTDITDKLGMKAPHEEPVCLACHASDVPKKLRGTKFQMDDGIGCETCHGGSENWLAAHTDKDASHETNLANGMYPSDDIVQRTRLCLSCHYGNDKQFVTHEIMGAGHPRISFEMDTFSELQPPHFVQDEDYKQRKTAYSNVKVWAVGQAVAAASVLEMLHSTHMRPNKLFPELSMFDCHSCHHRMSDKSWTPRRSTGLGPGVVPINDSSLLMLRHVIVPMDASLAWRFRKILKEMHQASTTDYASLVEKIEQLQAMVDSLTGKIVQHEFTAKDIQEITLSLINDGVWGEYQDYVAAEQSVMAISALTISWDKLVPFSDVRRENLKREIDLLYNIVDKDEAYNQKRFSNALGKLREIISGS